MARFALRMRRLIAVVTLLVAPALTWCHPSLSFGPVPGAVLFAEQRFDPAVQRLLAQRSLNALPIASGALFYIVPAALEPAAQQDQIRYLEYLLDKRALQEAVDATSRNGN